VTDVYSVNGEFELEAMDSEANTVSTPDGLEKATFVYNVPSGSILQRKETYVRFTIQVLLYLLL